MYWLECWIAGGTWLSAGWNRNWVVFSIRMKVDISGFLLGMFETVWCSLFACLWGGRGEEGSSEWQGCFRALVRGKGGTAGLPLEILTFMGRKQVVMCQNTSALQLWSCIFWVVCKSWRLCCFSGLVWVACCSRWCQWSCACAVQQAVPRGNPNPSASPSAVLEVERRGGSCLLTLTCSMRRDPALWSQGFVPC